MKFTILLTLLTTLNASALLSQGAKLNLSVKDKSLKEVIKMIENQSDFRFFFSDDYLDLNKKVTLTASNKGIDEVLNNLLEDGTITYKLMENNVIVITPSSAQQMKVTGVIVDAATNEPLPGVNVIVKSTTRGITTDIDGKFSIDVTKGETLVFSYIGYTNQEVIVGDVTDLRINLAADIKQLDEIVVIGYGTMKKKDVTGAVASVKQADIEANKAANVLQVIQGKVAGLDISQSTGQAGAGVKINLRGNRSILANKDPLILVDGVEYGTTLDLNPSDIESFDVLKDASSTAIYGTRGANGVILITTKKGGQGKTNVTFNAYIASNEASYIPDYMDGNQYAQKRIENTIADIEHTWYNTRRATYNAATGVVAWNQTLNPTPWTVFGMADMDSILTARNYSTQYQLFTADTAVWDILNNRASLDYMSMILRNTFTKNFELGVTGGDEKTGLGLSLGMMDDRGLLKNDKLRRYNLKVSVDHKVFKNVKVGSSIMYTYKDHFKRNNGLFQQALKTGTIGTLYNDDGTLKEFPDQFTYAQPNPILDDEEGAYLNEVVENRIFGSAYMNWEIIKGLNFKSNFGMNIRNLKTGIYQGPRSVSRIGTRIAQTDVIFNSTWSYTWDNTLSFQKTFGVHEIQALLGNSVIRDRLNETYQFTKTNQVVAATEFYDWNDGILPTPYSLFEDQKMLSYFGRLHYKFNEKYIFQVQMRSDGSSVLAEGNKWQYFPSASVAWRMNEENFLKNAQWLSNLKLRLSWGVSGNASVRPYQTVAAVSQGSVFYTIEDQIYSAYIPYNAPNKAVTWETTQTYNIGFDFGFFNNRINGGIEYYIANTTDLLLRESLPLSSVYPTVLANVGKTENKGIEISLNTQNIKTDIFEWTTDWNYALNRDKIIALTTDNKPFTEDVRQNSKRGNQNQIRRVGDPVLAFYDYEKIGIYQVTDLETEYLYVQQQIAGGDSIERGKIPMISNNYKPGDIKLRDVNGDGKFDTEDRIIYNMSPKYTFGITNNFNFGNASTGIVGLSIMLYGRIGQTIAYDFYYNYQLASQVVENGPYVDAWTPTNPGGTFPRYYTTGNAAAFQDAMQYVDGSYVKIKDITLSYSLPKNFLQKFRINNLKVYVTAKNMFTFAKIENYDPEIGGTQNFPLAKQIIGGINLNF